MAIFKDIDTYTKKSQVIGTEKIPVSDTEYITPSQIVGGKQDTLVSGTNIKTINDQSLIGSGNIQFDYLPVSGISQNETLQEFVMRESPATIPAKSLTLDRIYGKTLAWNQLVSSSASSVTIPSGRKYLSVIGETKSIGTSSGSAINVTGGSDMVIDLTLLYGSAIDGMTDAEILAKFESEFPGYHDYSAGKLISNDAESIETVGFNQWDEEWEVGNYYLGEKVSGQNNTIRCKNKIAIFPGETYFYKCQEYTDIIEYFDSAGAYIGRERTSSNSLFTVPSNAYYMVFAVSSDYGTTYNHDICINLFDTAKNGTYEPYIKSTMQLNLGSFQVRDSQGNVTTITGGLKSVGSVKDEIVGNKYIKRVGSVDMGDLIWVLNETYGFVATPSPDPKVGFSAICSKYVFKGAYTYVVDKSCGFIFNTGFLVKDSTYNDAATFKTAMSGVMLYYELATPIEYTLVSPLVSTVKAGITEERISPNSDGLSAPMVADMTYEVNKPYDASYSAYSLMSSKSDYATTSGSATKLQTARTIWGQSFDGSGDVSGDARASSFIKNGGTSSQFLKADGSVDSNTYATTNDLANAVGNIETLLAAI